MASETITVQSQCHCKANTFTTTIPTSSLPLEAVRCHCTSCRHMTGTLHLSDIRWPNPDEDLSRLHEYTFSARLRDYSCPTCFCRMFARNVEENHVNVLAGTLTNVPGLVNFNGHIFVGDTIDGGASVWMRYAIDGTRAPRWTKFKDESEELVFEWPHLNTIRSSTAEKARPEFTPLWCHCRGVEFFIRSGANLLLLPDSKVPSYVNKETGKYQALADGCNSCVKTSGADITYWFFAPFTHISTTDHPSEEPEFMEKSEFLKAVLRKDPKMGTLGVYQSSKEGHRFACTRCAAVICSAGDASAEQVRVAVGVLDHPDGARAEGLLEWKLDGIGFAEEGKGGWREELYTLWAAEATDWKSNGK